MITHASVAAWLDTYIRAWKTYDPQTIGGLFADKATYLYNPFDTEPVIGRDAIVANWLENRDKPGTYDAQYRVVAVDGDVAVAQGRSSYFAEDGKTLKKIYDNIFI